MRAKQGAQVTGEIKLFLPAEVFLATSREMKLDTARLSLANEGFVVFASPCADT